MNPSTTSPESEAKRLYEQIVRNLPADVIKAIESGWQLPEHAKDDSKAIAGQKAWKETKADQVSV